MKIQLTTTNGNTATLNCESVSFMPNKQIFSISFTPSQFKAFKNIAANFTGIEFEVSENIELGFVYVSILDGIHCIYLYSIDF